MILFCIIKEKKVDSKMQENKSSNYDKLSEEWRLKFLEMDKELLKKKLPEIRQENDMFFITHFGEQYGISLKDGTIFLVNQREKPVSNGVKMDIYNLFWYSKEDAFFMNRWVPFRDVRGASPFTPAFERNVLMPFAKTFEGHTEELKKAAEAIGGTSVKQGDVGYIIPAFDCIPMQYLFWDGDDEFSAQANILYDYSVTDYIHVESTVSLATEGILRLAEVAGLELKGNIFRM